MCSPHPAAPIPGIPRRRFSMGGILQEAGELSISDRLQAGISSPASPRVNTQRTLQRTLFEVLAVEEQSLRGICWRMINFA